MLPGALWGVCHVLNTAGDWAPPVAPVLPTADEAAALSLIAGRNPSQSLGKKHTRRFLTTQQWGLGSALVVTLAPALSAQGCPPGPHDKGTFPSWLFSWEKSCVWDRDGLSGETGDGLCFPGRE
ncbi:unnamed protein product [Rangifer tarandus platyrhynchus]|uniref:Uncharacterized protein n=1 Tax=Rangifer tarandus platyrhynchus TaxID=3082113 RepID=A0ABN8ZU80_RANTA|nr:unnamed protein product [Rangifer tarandus platyrhynchus]